MQKIDQNTQQSNAINWELNKVGEPIGMKGKSNYQKFMLILAGDSNELDSLKIEQIKHIGKTLFIPENPKSKDSKKIQSVRVTLINKYPNCFPHAQSFQMGEIVQIIERYDFFKKSHWPLPHFEIPLPHGMDSQNDKPVITNYFNYIRTGIIDINQHNIEKIFLIAKQENNPYLKNWCLNFVKYTYQPQNEFFTKNISFDVLIDFINYAFSNDMKNLKWISFIFAFNHYINIQLDYIINSYALCPQGRFLLILAKNCAHFGFTPFFKEIKDYPSKNTFKTGLKINGLSKEHIQSQQNLFADIYNFLDVENLEFHDQIDNTLFIKLMTPFINQSIKPIECLSYKDNKMKPPSAHHFSSVKNLLLKGDGPQNLNLPNALFLSCEESITINFIECTVANKIICTDCQNLEILKAYEADEVHLKNCSNLKLLIVKSECKIIGKRKLPKNCVLEYVK